jgi:hypothetical protein
MEGSRPWHLCHLSPCIHLSLPVEATRLIVGYDLVDRRLRGQHREIDRDQRLTGYRNLKIELTGWRRLNRPYHHVSGNRISKPSSQNGYMMGMLVPLGASR